MKDEKKGTLDSPQEPEHTKPKGDAEPLISPSPLFGVVAETSQNPDYDVNARITDPYRTTSQLTEPPKKPELVRGNPKGSLYDDGFYPGSYENEFEKRSREEHRVILRIALLMGLGLGVIFLLVRWLIR